MADAPTWGCILAWGVWLQGAWVVVVWRQLRASTLPSMAAAVPPSNATPATATLIDTTCSSSPASTGLVKESVVALAQQGECSALLSQNDVPKPDVEQDMLRYALSHDLRAPLRVIDGFTRIVKEDHGRHLDRLGNDHLDRVLAASARMSGMIDAVLAQAQLAGAPLTREHIDLSALAHEVSEELRAVSPEVACQARVHIADGLVVLGDPILVRRILENLLSNALKYSAKVANPCVEVGSMPATNPTVYFVRDNGAGFDMQHADKLFGLFQRLHSAKEFPGTGVGLAGVHNIVGRHGGRVWADAKPGQGACFYFTLVGTIGTSEAQRAATSS